MIDARVKCLRDRADEAVKSVGKLSQLGIGWDRSPRFVAAWNEQHYVDFAGHCLLWLLGVIAAAYAASLGGDFWFKWLADIIRLTGYKPQSAAAASGTGK